MAEDFQFDMPPSGGIPIISATVRKNFNAIGVLNLTQGVESPKNPRDGMPRLLVSGTELILQVYWNSAWRTVIDGIGNPALIIPRRLEADFLSSTIWQFDHNLGRRPIIQCLDSNLEVIYPQKVEHSGVNRVIATHTTATAGKIIVVG